MQELTLEQLPFDALKNIFRESDTRMLARLMCTSKELLESVEQSGEWRKRFKYFFPRQDELLVAYEDDTAWHRLVQLLFQEEMSSWPEIRWSKILSKAFSKFTLPERTLWIALVEKDRTRLNTALTKLSDATHFDHPQGLALIACATFNGFGQQEIWDVIKGSNDPSALLLLGIALHRPCTELEGLTLLPANSFGVPLLLACEFNYVDAARFLMRRGAETKGLFREACLTGNLRAVQLLAADDARDLLESVCKEGHFHIVKYLLEELQLACDPVACFYTAAIYDHLNIAAYFLEKKRVDISAEIKVPEGKIAVWSAVIIANESMNFLRFAIAHGAVLNNIKDFVLISYCLTGHLDVVRLLVEQGVTFNVVHEYFSENPVDKKDFLKTVITDLEARLEILRENNTKTKSHPFHKSKEFAATVCLYNALQLPVVSNIAILDKFFATEFSTGWLGCMYALCKPLLVSEVNPLTPKNERFILGNLFRSR